MVGLVELPMTSTRPSTLLPIISKSELNPNPKISNPNPKINCIIVFSEQHVGQITSLSYWLLIIEAISTITDYWVIPEGNSQDTEPIGHSADFSLEIDAILFQERETTFKKDIH